MATTSGVALMAKESVGRERNRFNVQ